MIRIPPVFSEFLRLLTANDARYLVVGGHAVSYHGYPRSTGDLDVWIEQTSENARRVQTAVAEFGFDVPNLTSDMFLTDDRVIRMGHPPLRIEILTSIDGVRFEDAYPNRSIEELDGAEVSFIGLADLRENKRISGRYRDLDDLENLPRPS